MLAKGVGTGAFTVGYYRAMSFTQERSSPMSRRFRRPPVMDTMSVISGYSSVIEQGYALLNSIPEECSADRSILGSMLAKYKAARSGLADLVDLKVGPLLNGAPEIVRESRITWDSDRVDPDGQRIANHHISDTGSSVVGSSSSKETINMSCKVVRTGVVVSGVDSATHEPAAPVAVRPLVAEVIIEGNQAVTVQASGRGWASEEGVKGTSFTLASTWVRIYHYDWTPDTHSVKLSDGFLFGQLGRSLKGQMWFNDAGVALGEVKRGVGATWYVRFGKLTAPKAK